jgi:hypothetical protein
MSQLRVCAVTKSVQQQTRKPYTWYANSHVLLTVVYVDIRRPVREAAEVRSVRVLLHRLPEEAHRCVGAAASGHTAHAVQPGTRLHAAGEHTGGLKLFALFANYRDCRVSLSFFLYGRCGPYVLSHFRYSRL